VHDAVPRVSARPVTGELFNRDDLLAPLRIVARVGDELPYISDLASDRDRLLDPHRGDSRTARSHILSGAAVTFASTVSVLFHLPASVHYSPERHVWARPDEAGFVTVGVAAPLREVLWHAPDVEYWAVDRVEVGSPIATARARHGRQIAIASPVAGTLIEVNELLAVAPQALVFQPYVRGWVARVYADNWERDSVGLLSGSAGAAEYRARLERTLAVSRPSAFAGVLL
jgi:glycine cleavage system H protein